MDLPSPLLSLIVSTVAAAEKPKERLKLTKCTDIFQAAREVHFQVDHVLARRAQCGTREYKRESERKRDRGGGGGEKNREVENLLADRRRRKAA